MIRASIPPAALARFVEESNRIERIDGVSRYELDAHEKLLELDRVTVADLEEFVSTVASASLRRNAGQDVYIRGSSHRPPPGGPQIEKYLDHILVQANGGICDPYEVHVGYESLHPFTDGNGRSGRALWAWQMLHEGRDPFALPFLQRFYYQTLDAAGEG